MAMADQHAIRVDKNGPAKEHAISVLYIDDQSDGCRAFRRSMEPFGFRVVTASSARQAIRLAHRQFFPVVVTDYKTPEIDGVSLIARLRRVCPVSAFVLTAGASNGTVPRSQEVDAAIASIVSKPWDDEEMAETIRRVALISEGRRRPSETPSQGDQLVILVVQDDRREANLVVELLSTLAPQDVVVVSRIEDATARLLERKISLILADLALPDGRGLDAVIRLYRASPETPIVVLSSLEDDVLSRQALRLGAQDYLVKGSFGATELVRSVRFALERKRAEQEVAELARIDPLTGLANRVTFRDRLSQALLRARRQQRGLALFRLDLDRFKEINDTAGHDAGDALLQEVAERLRGVLRRADTVARLGGDEFAVLAEDCTDRANGLELAERIRRALEPAAVVEGKELVATASIGLALFPESDETLDGLMKAADVAMYAAKSDGRNRYAIFRPSKTTIRPRDLDRELREALEGDQLRLDCRPQYALAEGALLGFEARLGLERSGTTIGQAELLPLLAGSGLSQAFGMRLVELACAEWRRWGREELTLSLALPPSVIESAGFAGQLKQLIKPSGVNPRQIVLSIGETNLLRDSERSERGLSALTGVGVRLAVEDFGRTSSPLDLLARYGVSRLCIGSSLLKPGEGPPVGAAAVAVARALNLEVLVTDLTTKAQLDQAAHIGCDLVTGPDFEPPGTSRSGVPDRLSDLSLS